MTDEDEYPWGKPESELATIARILAEIVAEQKETNKHLQWLNENIQSLQQDLRQR